MGDGLKNMQFDPMSLGLHGSGSGGGGGGAQPAQPGNLNKEKKKPSLQKQIGSKISTNASKLAEITAWEAKLKELPDM